MVDDLGYPLLPAELSGHRLSLDGMKDTIRAFVTDHYSEYPGPSHLHAPIISCRMEI